MPDYRDKSVLVLGGSSGIGKATARHLLAGGARVIIAGRSSDKLAQAADELGGGARLTTAAVDMTDERHVADLAAGFADAALDSLIISASASVHGPFAELDPAQARQMFESKFWGPYYAARAFLPKLATGGSLVFFSGVLSRRPGRNCSALGAVNAAVEGLTHALALELGPGLRVNCVSPGMVRSEAYATIPDDKREAMYRNTGESLPIGRVGEAHELAEAAAFAAFNGYLTGQVLDVDGGHMIRQYAQH